MYTPVNVVKTSTSLVFTCNFFTQTIVFSGDNCIQNKFMKNYSGVIEPTIIRWFSSFFSNKDIFDGVCVGEYTMYLEYTEHSPQYSFQSNRVQFHKPLTGEVIFVSKKMVIRIRYSLSVGNQKKLVLFLWLCFVVMIIIQMNQSIR